MKVNTKVDEYLLSGNYIKCDTFKEVQYIIGILRVSNIVTLRYTHSDHRYKKEIDLEGKVFLYLQNDDELWVLPPYLATGRDIGIDYFINSCLY